MLWRTADKLLDSLVFFRRGSLENRPSCPPSSPEKRSIHPLTGGNKAAIPALFPKTFDRSRPRISAIARVNDSRDPRESGGPSTF